MADCTKTVEFLREWKRLIDDTVFVDLNDLKTPRALLVYNKIMSDLEHPEEAITYVQKWSDEHPVMTWEGKLKELLPNVDMSKIIGTCCPYNLLGGKAPNMETCRSSGDYEDCVNCWNGEYKEEP